MSEPALIVSQSGEITRGLEALVAAQGYDPIPTLVGDRPEDGRYYLSQATIERIERQWIGDSDPLTVVVDGTPHPGQTVDLRTRLSSATILDRRRILWDRLAEANPVAATRVELRKARITRRRAADSQRGRSTRGPSGTSGQLADSDERIQSLRDTLDGRQERARKRVRTGHTATDARVVLLGRVGTPRSALCTALTGANATSGIGRPARVATATATVGPHTLAVTDTPGVPGSDGLPGWLTEVVPGLSVALDQAACVLGVGESHDTLLETVAERFDVTCRSLDSADATTAREVLGDVLESAVYAVRLPYSDDTQALVSELHDGGTVHATEYDDAVYVRVEVARSATEKLRRRVSAVGGEITSLDPDG